MQRGKCLQISSYESMVWPTTSYDPAGPLISANQGWLLEQIIYKIVKIYSLFISEDIDSWSITVGSFYPDIVRAYMCIIGY